MSKIFISYRRRDSQASVDRIYDRLSTRFGETEVFKDTTSIPPGSTWPQLLKQEVRNCQVLLAIIGSQWLDVIDEKGQPRLWLHNDWVKSEIEEALVRARNDCNILVIPVLVNFAQMPKAEDLPEAIRELADIHAATIRNDPDFETDITKLMKSLEQHFKEVDDKAKIDFDLQIGDSSTQQASESESSYQQSDTLYNVKADNSFILPDFEEAFSEVKTHFTERIEKIRGILGPLFPVVESENCSANTYNNEKDFNILNEFLSQCDWIKAESITIAILLHIEVSEDYLELSDLTINELSLQRIEPNLVKAIDDLWCRYSNNNFGFSVQKTIFLESCKRLGYQPDKLTNENIYDDIRIWECFCKQIGWCGDSNSSQGFEKINFERGFWPSYKLYQNHSKIYDGSLVTNCLRLLTLVDSFN
jgi:hypothetical protein